MRRLPKVSVIMPSLNVAKYIRECMDSVVNQSLKDIEILAVDASSTDGTLEILREYEARDSRIKVILSDKKSYGYQMNLGLDAAMGEYIGVVETDDILMPDTYFHLALQADAYALDYVKGYAYDFFDLGNGSRYISDSARIDIVMKQRHNIISPSEMPELLQKDIFLWPGIYRKKFLQTVRFNETPGAAFQDQGFLLQTISTAKRALYVERPVYLYRHDNLASSTYSTKAFRYLAEEYSLNEPLLVGKDVKWKTSFYYRLWQQASTRIRLMIVFGREWSLDSNIESVRQKFQSACNQKYIDLQSFSREDFLLVKLFIENPEAVYNFYLEEYTPKLQNLRSILAWAKEHPVLIWGSGKWGKFAHALLMRNGASTVEAYVDSNLALWGTQTQGEEVLSPEEAATRFPDAYYLIANKRDGGEIQARLLQNGISEDRICCPKTIDTDLWLLARPLI